MHGCSCIGFGCLTKWRQNLISNKSFMGCLCPLLFVTQLLTLCKQRMRTVHLRWLKYF